MASQRGSGWPGLDLMQAADNIDALFPKCSPKQVGRCFLNSRPTSCRPFHDDLQCQDDSEKQAGILDDDHHEDRNIINIKRKWLAPKMMSFMIIIFISMIIIFIIMIIIFIITMIINIKREMLASNMMIMTIKTISISSWLAPKMMITISIITMTMIINIKRGMLAPKMHLHSTVDDSWPSRGT